MPFETLPIVGARHAAHRRQRVDYWSERLPVTPMGTAIPKVVHQTYPTRDLPEVLRNGLDRWMAENPSWAFRLYSSDEREAFIRDAYGEEILETYRKIRPEYGAARADLFRYLLIYRLGGVYLDIKSRFTVPIDDVIRGDEGFIVSQWRNDQGSEHAGIGLLPELADIPGGEFQQWHVIACPGHPFLRAVIIAVLANIDSYSPWFTNVGRIGVLRLTGPIVYTRAIAPLLEDYPHVRIVGEGQIAMQYSAYERAQIFTTKHYSQLTIPVVRTGTAGELSGWLFRRALGLKALLKRGG